MNSLQFIQDSKKLEVVAVPLMDPPSQVPQSSSITIRKKRKQRRRRKGEQKIDSSSTDLLAVQTNVLAAPEIVQPHPSPKKRRGIKKGTKQSHNSSTGTQATQLSPLTAWQNTEASSSTPRRKAKRKGGKHHSTNSASLEDDRSIPLTTPSSKKRKRNKGKRHHPNSPAAQQNAQPSPLTPTQLAQFTVRSVEDQVPHGVFSPPEESFIESSRSAANPGVKTITIFYIRLSDEESVCLIRIVHELVKSILVKQRLHKRNMDLCPLVNVLIEQVGASFLASITMPQLANRLHGLCSHLKYTNLKTIGQTLPEIHQKEAVSLIKQFIARPGRVPTDVDA